MGAMGSGGQGRLVAVVGATGRQGSAVTRHLLADGWRVRALTRDPSRPVARELHERGAQLLLAEMGDLASLQAAFAGADAVFNVQNPMTSGLAAEVRFGGNVAEAAARSGVNHVVYGAAGVGGAPTGVGSWDSKLAVSSEFRRRGLRLTMLRPMAFMELMTDKGFYPPVAAWGLMPRLMGSDRPVGWVCTDDLGAIAARAFADPDRWGGVELPIAADVKSISECRAIWQEVTGRRPRSMPMPVPLFERFVGSDLTTMWRWLGTHDLDLSTDATRTVLPEARTVREWLARTLHPGR